MEALIAHFRPERRLEIDEHACHSCIAPCSLAQRATDESTQTSG